ncbi:MAG: hypothetical protein CVT48_06280 [Thermoplasmata archaeon HGW-Thermoplasmata-1]|nr:MAG: hypothetical protein CVT48_06280 [Thermoplasmata archaeon HGW-Thermoplasmata-1]
MRALKCPSCQAEFELEDFKEPVCPFCGFRGSVGKRDKPKSRKAAVTVLSILLAASFIGLILLGGVCYSYMTNYDNLENNTIPLMDITTT